MSLKEQLMQDYKDAMKSADAVKKETVNMVRAAIKQYEVDQRVELSDDADIVKIIKKQVKMRTDALADFVVARALVARAGLQAEADILGDVHRLEQRILLEDEADAAVAQR